LTPADPFYHIAKNNFTIPFVCGCTNLGEAIRRVAEGAAMIRTKGEAGTGNVVSAVQHARLVKEEILHAKNTDSSGIEDMVNVIMKGFNRMPDVSEFDISIKNTPFGSFSGLKKEVEAILLEVVEMERLPVVTFSAGGIATPADAALMMNHGMDGIFVGSGIFKSSDPKTTAEAIVLATHRFQDPDSVAEASRMIGEPMPGLEIETLDVRMEKRGW